MFKCFKRVAAFAWRSQRQLSYHLLLAAQVSTTVGTGFHCVSHVFSVCISEKVTSNWISILVNWRPPELQIATVPWHWQVLVWVYCIYIYDRVCVCVSRLKMAEVTLFRNLTSTCTAFLPLENVKSCKIKMMRLCGLNIPHHPTCLKSCQHLQMQPVTALPGRLSRMKDL